MIRRLIVSLISLAVLLGTSGCGLIRERMSATPVAVPDNADVVERDLSQPYERAQ